MPALLAATVRQRVRRPAPSVEPGARRQNRLRAGALDEPPAPMPMSPLYPHIETTPGVAGGRPRIAGRRITVADVAVWHEQVRLSADEISAAYDLSLAEVHAALAYYFDHREEVDRSLREGAALAEAVRERTSSPVAEKLRRLGEAA